MAVKREATIEELFRVGGKAELVGGEVRVMTPAGGLHGYAALEIAASLREYSKRAQRGVALGDNIGFVVNLPNRRSFCPDAAFWNGAPPTAGFFDGAPIFAAEVRSPEDFGTDAERMLASKRADYFAAGTLVVWDVDILREHVVRVYRADNPTAPVVHGHGEHADAEPAVPGWSMAVDDLFPLRR
jgi:Uma2 family endonuclease